MNRICGNSIMLAEKSLDYLWYKQSVTLTNIANNETPGYKAKYVTFEDVYRNRLLAASGNSRDVRNAIDRSKWTVKESETASTRADGNNVVADTEQAELARTALQYQYVIQSLNSDITRLSTVIKG